MGHSGQTWKPVIGLEVHAQLRTQAKVFAPEGNAVGREPNTLISVVSLAHPGTLPKVNLEAIELALRMTLAVGGEVSREMIFDRKNYFYPDLPKGYQLTQDRTPVCRGGEVEIQLEGRTRRIPLQKIHLEEDAGKLLHDGTHGMSRVDYNRAGVPLIEMVTPPVIESAAEAGAFLTEVRRLVRYLGICDGNMEDGSLRCDANISVAPAGSQQLGAKVEVKNMNSIRHLQRAIEFEIDRQTRMLGEGKTITSETRTYDASDGKTYSMRQKETLNDYRYFPDPDLAPVVIDEAWLEKVRAAMPPLPAAVRKKLQEEYSLSAYDAGVISETRELARYFESLAELFPDRKMIANWLMGPVKSWMNETGHDADHYPVRADRMAGILRLVSANQISHTTAQQQLLPAIMNSTAEAATLAAELNLMLESNQESLATLVDEIIREFPLKVEEFRKGKKGIVSMFMGEVMKRTGGKADPKRTMEIVNQKLSKS